MPYTPTNHPYIPGDPYSYDMKWMVKAVKDTIAEYEEVNDNANAAIATANSASATAAQAVNKANNAVANSAASKAAAESASAAATGARNAAISAQGSAETAATNANNSALAAAASAASAATAAAATGVKVYDIIYDSDTGKYLAQLPDASQATLDEFLRRIVDGTCKVRFGIDMTDTMVDSMIQLFKSPGIDRYIAVFRLIVDTGPANTRRLYEYSTTIYLDTTPAYYTPINAPNMFNIAVTTA